MRLDFRVLSHTATDHAWAEAAGHAYRAGNFDGLYLRIQKGLRLPHLGDLRNFPSLRYLEVNGGIKDDSAAFSVDSLIELVLLTRCMEPIPRLASTNLIRLGLDDRPGKEHIGGLANLGDLSIWQWRGEDFQFLKSARRLHTLHIEGTRQRVSLDGLENCPDIEDIEILEVQVRDLTAVATLSRLRRIWLIGYPGAAPSDTVLDLSAIAELTRLEEFRLTFSPPVKSVRPLTNMQSLHEIRLRGTPILDGDETPLVRIAETGIVVRPSE